MRALLLVLLLGCDKGEVRQTPSAAPTPPAQASVVPANGPFGDKAWALVRPLLMFWDSSAPDRSLEGGYERR